METLSPPRVSYADVKSSTTTTAASLGGSGPSTVSASLDSSTRMAYLVEPDDSSDALSASVQLRATNEQMNELMKDCVSDVVPRQLRLARKPGAVDVTAGIKDGFWLQRLTCVVTAHQSAAVLVVPL
uniref:Uncharacterized protein n=1 Tax=Glossina pallidipes TaxID=7398 RepID=A0A1B0A1H3_GLOPL